MTIEAVSYPADLSNWDWHERPFCYLELFGETQPQVDPGYAELISAPATQTTAADRPAHAVPTTPQATASAPVYEYWWTLGHLRPPGTERGREPLFHSAPSDRPPDLAAGPAIEFWDNLADDPAALVYMYFPLSGGWRIKELAATVKYLDPVPTQSKFWEQVAADWKLLSPLVADAGTLAGALGPEVGVPVKGTVATLDAIAKLKLGSVPQQGAGFDWSVGKVTFAQQDERPERAGAWQGVVWRLPAKMFRELGGRLTGSLAVSFIPCGQQRHGAPASEPALEQRAVLAHATLRSNGGQEHCMVPDGGGFVRLELQPRWPDGHQPTPAPH